MTMTDPGRLMRGARRTVRRVVGFGAIRARRTPPKVGRRRAGPFLESLDSFPTPVPVPSLSTLSAAVAAGERVKAGLAWEWAQIALSPDSWRDAVEAENINLVLVEISGGSVPGWGARGGAALVELLDWARSSGVPVVAWVTGGSVDVELAESWVGGVAQVFVDRDDVLERWRSRWPAVAVDVLGPAAQPRLHNPRTGGPGRRREAAAAVIVHGGSPTLESLGELPYDHVDLWPVDAAAAAVLHGTPLQRSMVKGRRLDPSSPTISLYRVLAEVGVIRNTPSWSVVEAASAQTAVVIEERMANRVPANLRGLVTVAEDDAKFRLDLAARCWQEELRDREGVRLARAVWDEHTYAHRVDRIANAVGLETKREGGIVSTIVPTNRMHELDNALDNISRQEHVIRGRAELILVLHGLDVKVPELEARARDLGVENVTVIQADRELTLGACMNLGVDAASGDLIAKMDDDNYYGQHYLTDLVGAFGYTDAGIVGKWAHYVWLRSTGAVVLRCGYAEHRYDRLVQGGSMLIKGDVARELRFGDLPRAVDTDFLERAREAGVLTYSADRFNYVSIRAADHRSHTWPIADTALMNRAGSLLFYGDPRPHVDV